MSKISNEVYAKRIRQVELHKDDAISAFELYREWRRLNHYAVPKDFNRFIKTRVYPHFFKLAQFIKKVHVSDTSAYLQVMKKKGYKEGGWTNNYAYKAYLDHMDNHENPIDVIGVTVDRLLTLSETEDVSVLKAIVDMHIGDMLMMIQRRQLTPWILLNSDVLKKKIFDADEYYQKEILNLIPVNEWKIRMHENSEALSLALNVVEEFEL